MACTCFSEERTVDNGSVSSAQALSAMMAFIATFWFVALLIYVFYIWMFWRIFSRAGFGGALALLNLVPGIGHLVCLLILAFGTWPNERQVVPAQPITPSA
jgi:hypothetical protein